jgi:branched-chain amino acid transport system substrate-binding protein
MNITRRPALAALLAAPALSGVSRAQGQPLKLGVPTAMTGTWAALGAQVVRSCRLWAKTVNAEGGLLGRPVEFLFEDTQGVPANCLRKAQEMVERDRVNILLGLMASSEALAVMPKLADWNALFISSVNGAGSITAEAWVPNARWARGRWRCGCAIRRRRISSRSRSIMPGAVLRWRRLRGC